MASRSHQRSPWIYMRSRWLQLIPIPTLISRVSTYDSRAILSRLDPYSWANLDLGRNYFFFKYKQCSEVFLDLKILPKWESSVKFSVNIRLVWRRALWTGDGTRPQKWSPEAGCLSLLPQAGASLRVSCSCSISSRCHLETASLMNRDGPGGCHPTLSFVFTGRLSLAGVPFN